MKTAVDTAVRMKDFDDRKCNSTGGFWELRLVNIDVDGMFHVFTTIQNVSKGKS